MNYKVFFAKALNLTPIFHPSEDNEFGSVNDALKLRLSMFCLSWGVKKYYLVTYSEKFSWIYTLGLSNIRPKITEEDWKRLGDKFDKSITEDVAPIYSDFLKYKISSVQDRLSNLNRKMNNYRSISIAAIACLFYLITQITPFVGLSGALVESVLTTAAIILLILTFESVFNVVKLVLDSLEVKPNLESRFSHVKDKPDECQVAKFLYLDYQSSQKEAEFSASLVINVEKYLLRGILFGFFTWFMLAGLSINFDTYDSPVSGVKSEFIIFNQKGEFQADELHRFSEQITEDDETLIIYHGDGGHNATSVSFLESIVNTKSAPNKVVLSSDILNGNPLIIRIQEK